MVSGSDLPISPMAGVPSPRVCFMPLNRSNIFFLGVHIYSDLCTKFWGFIYRLIEGEKMHLKLKTCFLKSRLKKERKKNVGKKKKCVDFGIDWKINFRRKVKRIYDLDDPSHNHYSLIFSPAF